MSRTSTNVSGMWLGADAISDSCLSLQSWRKSRVSQRLTSKHHHSYDFLRYHREAQSSFQPLLSRDGVHTHTAERGARRREFAPRISLAQCSAQRKVGGYLADQFVDAALAELASPSVEMSP